MELVFATPVPPVAFKRRPHAFIRRLAARGHRVHLLTQVPSTEAEQDLLDDPSWGDVRGACASVTLVRAPKSRSLARCLRALPTGRPLRVAYCAEPAFVTRTEQVCRNVVPALVHVDRPRLATLLAHLPVVKILDATDALTPYLREVRRTGPFGERLLAGVELRTMPAYEARMTSGYDATIVTTAAEARALRDLGAGGPLVAVPNGVDESFLEIERRPTPARVLFVGVMNYPPNVDAVTWFVREVWPRVVDRYPDARFHIVGAEAGRNIRRLARDTTVAVRGRVDDLAPHLGRAAITVAPMRIGGGFSNKLVEYLASGAPTVATSAVVDTVPGVVPGEHVLLADTAAGFAAQVSRLLGDAEHARQLGERGRDLVRREHRWDAVIDRLEKVYRDVTSR